MSMVDQRCFYTHLAANGTTNILAGGGFLHAVTINSKGASSNVLTLTDLNAPGGSRTIAVIDTTSQIGTLRYDILISSLTAVMGTGTAADVTIAWLG
jgi:hypothetical protein